MSDIGQLSLREPAHVAGVARWRRMRRPKLSRVPCTTLYAMHLASGVPVEMEPGICPVCGSRHCKLARALAHRG